MEGILKDKKVLIVEDEPSMSDALAERFETEGCRILRARDGEAALALANQETPDLILLDLLMPKKNGIEVLEAVRKGSEWGKTVPIIILTNLSADEAITRSVANNEPSYYLVKTDWKLYEVVQKAMECFAPPSH
jgi:DNA-binding response OmpR family regulator